MSDTPNGTPSTPASTPAREAPEPLTALLLDQRRRWPQGERVLVETYLGRQPALRDDVDAVLDLVYNEVVLREQVGEVPRLAEYLERFPELADQLQVQFEMDRALHSAGPTPSARVADATPFVGLGERSEPDPASLPALPGYRVLDVLGRGGMGVVYKTWQEGVNRLVAVKMILAGVHAGREHVARFRAEAEAVGQLHHPNIVQIYEVGEYDGRPFLSLEYLAGGSLDRQLDAAPLPPVQAATLVQKLARAVQYAHERGIVHRDLKPANVLLTESGEPKVTDFGLAKRLQSDTAVTPAGEVLGTPSYMAPEQASGQSGLATTAADVYSLGAILYELLARQPPFRADTPLATVQQVLHQSPRPLRALRPGLPRDLEVICLKCLEKLPERRYASAAALADDLERFLHGEPVAACPPSAWYRVRKFAGRNKTGLAVAGLVLVLVLLLAGGVGWVVRDQTARQTLLELEVGRAVDEAQSFCRDERLPEAMAAVQRAEVLLAGGGGSEELLRRVEQVRADVALASQLEEIRLSRATILDGHFDNAGADQRYGDAFRSYGLSPTVLDEDQAAERIKTSAIKDHLVAALHDWLHAKMIAARPGSQRLLAVLQRADADTWRNQFRAAFLRKDKKALADLARSPQARKQPPATLVLLAGAFFHLGDRPLAIAFLRTAQQQHPNDFWINHNLAYLLLDEGPAQAGEAVGYYRAALAARPDCLAVRLHLGNALRKQGDLPGALATYQQAIALGPKFPEVHYSVGNVLLAQGDLAGAIAAYRQAITLKPDLVVAHYNLGIALRKQKDHAGAIAAYRQAIVLKPDYVHAHINLGNALHDRGDLAGACAAYEKVIALRPKFAGAHYRLGRALREQHDLAGAVAAYSRAMTLAPENAEAHFHLGFVLGKQGDWPGAIAAYQRAIAIKPDYAEVHCNLGNVLVRQGEFRKALALLRRGHELGSRNPSWAYPSAQWVRDCERLIELDDQLPGFLAGTNTPASANECIESAQLCAWKRLHRTAVRFYEQGFAEQPNLLPGQRYNAACAAALAGCGQGDDAAKLDDQEYERLRTKARRWLGDQLVQVAKQLGNNPPALRQRLARWQQEPALAGLREPAQLARLPLREQPGWRQFWAKVTKTLEGSHGAP